MKELEIKLKEYKETFDDDFPTFCFMHLSEKEMEVVVGRCLVENQDVYTLGYLKDDSGVNY